MGGRKGIHTYRKLMKRILHISALVIALAALAACVKESVSAGSDARSKVTFLAAAYSTATKADEGAAFSTSGSFGSYAFYTSDWTDWGQYMDNECISYDSTENIWAPSLDFYWPKAARVSFLSYAPYSASDPWISASLSDPETFVAKDKSPSADDDWLFADYAADYNGWLDTGGYNHVGNTPDFTGVPAFFRHALSRVSFTVGITSIGDSSAPHSVTTTIDKPRELGFVSTEDSPAITQTSTVDEDRGHRTVTTTKKWTVVRSMAEAVTVTDIEGARKYSLKVNGAELRFVAGKGTLSLSPDKSLHSNGKPGRLPWKGDWTPSAGEPSATIPSKAPLADIDALGQYTLIDATTVLPQSLEGVQIWLKYEVGTEAPKVSITTYDRTWTVTETYTSINITVYDILNGDRELSSDDGATSMEQSYSESKDPDDLWADPAHTKYAEKYTKSSNNIPFLIPFEKMIAIDGQGGISRWEMGKIYSYSISIAPSGNRITWDPAVDEWNEFLKLDISL